jgi:hypothetical protein
MGRPKGRQRWRMISYSVAPFLAVLAGLLLVDADSAGWAAGVFFALLAVLAILLPVLVGPRR